MLRKDFSRLPKLWSRTLLARSLQYLRDGKYPEAITILEDIYSNNRRLGGLLGTPRNGRTS